ncbi:hypothetical protein LIER_32176 [Lithospermum erythrorhizon]|uniref:non-specific serine/threonine protein kinase n=1 Tax=Lithospermum erythrorhizon TaxID=34254 RepID=A0AAV3RT57_LITER
MATIFKILFLHCFLFHTAMSIPNITTDQSTLLQFKSKIIDPHYFLKNWLANKSVCEYTGVACSTVHNRVITLNISNMGLIGNVPPGLGNLSFLKSLTLRLNNFTGILPQDFVHLRRLRLLDVGFNQFIGNLPIWLFSMSKIEYLSLSYNNFTGSMSPLISNLTSLKAFTIGNNSLEGRIPQEFGNLENLILLDLQSNKFTGPMPNICNISTLESMAFADNQLNGVLPTDLCHCFPRLKNLYLGANQFVGEIPSSLHECSSLQYLSLEFNNFNGSIPRGIGNLTMLKGLRLQENNFSGHLPKEIGSLEQLKDLVLYKNSFSGVIPDSISNCSKLEQFQLADNLFTGSVGGHASNELSIITSLTHCRNLQHVLLYGNLLNGSVPKSIGNFSSKLETFHISNSYMSGIIPDEIGNLTSLVTLFFGKNMFSGHIPKTINNLKLLQLLSIRENQISGQIPDGLCEMQSLSYLLINSNRISGEIPACVGTMKSLRQLNLSDNLLGSSIPLSFWSLRDLLVLSISMNNFSGSLPLEVGKLDGLALMDLSSNRFSGNVPTTLGDLISLQGLLLGNNRFQGSIPESLGNMFGLEVLDLSNNDLNGEIPMSLQNLSYLKIFNVSFNKLVGEIPSEGPFLRFDANYFTSNEALCGNPRFNVAPCVSHSAKGSKRKKILFWILVPIGIVSTIVMLTMAVVLLKCKRPKQHPAEENIVLPLRRISYQELFQATSSFNSSNLLGMGSFGSVYKGVLNDGTTFAVKVFNLQVHGAFKSFEVECEALRNLRHRNLTKVITSCSNPDFKALVLEYMPNGSLEKWLHSDGYFIDMLQSLDIMVDVADALEYLHHGFPTPIVHCDLKPSNILLDENMSAHVSDFGLTKFMNEESFIHTRTLATWGYIAPEYGSQGLVSTAADVYSFGIMMMETFTRKEPSDEIFTENLNIKDWVHGCLLKNELAQVIVSDLLSSDEQAFKKEVQCMSSIMELALNCCVESPQDRMNMKDVHISLQKIKLQFQKSTGSGGMITGEA